MKKKNTHGGRRSNQTGRPPKGDRPKVHVAFRLDADVNDYLASTESKIETLESTVKRSKGFREFLKNREEK